MEIDELAIKKPLFMPGSYKLRLKQRPVVYTMA